jgi:hypothetical protein
MVYVVVSSPPATEETGALGREIESRQGTYRGVAFTKKQCTYMALLRFSLHTFHLHSTSFYFIF